MDVTVFSSGWFLPEMGPRRPFQIRRSAVPFNSLRSSPLYGQLFPLVHVSACRIRIWTCTGSYRNRRRTASVLPEAQRPSLLHSASNLPHRTIDYIRPLKSHVAVLRNPPCLS
jgi:hypothetical protein